MIIVGELSAKKLGLFLMKLNNRYTSNRLMYLQIFLILMLCWGGIAMTPRGEQRIGATSDFTVRRADFRKRGEI